MNSLRAGVLGANDGIVSVAALLIGVIATGAGDKAILMAGLAATIAGAVSMGLGEYVSVSSQSDSEKALIEKERGELTDDPDAELAELTGLYQARGLTPETAARVATELTEHDALQAHLSMELNIDPDDVVSPWHAAFASAIAFTIGALLPLATILLIPHPANIVFTFIAVLLALAITGYVAAWIGGARPWRAVTRTVIGGAIALTATYLVGTLFGTTIG